MLLSAVMLYGILSICASAGVESTSNIPTVQDLSDYQTVIDKLNEEYGYSMYFDPVLFSGESNYKNPLESTLAEFEATLREEIEDYIRVNAESAKAIAALGDVEWLSVPYKAQYWEAPLLHTCNLIEPDEIYENFDSQDEKSDNSNTIVSYALETDDKDINDKTVTSVQARLDPNCKDSEVIK